MRKNIEHKIDHKVLEYCNFRFKKKSCMHIVMRSVSLLNSKYIEVRQACEVENNIVSVERIQEYIGLTPEAPWKIKETIPTLSWPEFGSVEFNDTKVL